MVTRSVASGEPHKWEFKTRFRRHAFGWKSQMPITRIRQGPRVGGIVESRVYGCIEAYISRSGRIGRGSVTCV